MPSASAVVSDMASLALGNWQNTFNRLAIWPDLAQDADQLPIGAVRTRYYLRILCDDRPGVLGHVTTILGQKNISISSVLQHEPTDGETPGVPVVITTYEAVEGDMLSAIEEIDDLDEINEPTVCIGILEEYPEEIE
jgi:homoserine dehydrogenase